jgi:hypothetical protein
MQTQQTTSSNISNQPTAHLGERHIVVEVVECEVERIKGEHLQSVTCSHSLTSSTAPTLVKAAVKYDTPHHRHTHHALAALGNRLAADRGVHAQGVASSCGVDRAPAVWEAAAVALHQLVQGGRRRLAVCADTSHTGWRRSRLNIACIHTGTSVVWLFLCRLWNASLPCTSNSSYSDDRGGIVHCRRAALSQESAPLVAVPLVAVPLVTVPLIVGLLPSLSLTVSSGSMAGPLFRLLVFIASSACSGLRVAVCSSSAAGGHGCV